MWVFLVGAEHEKKEPLFIQLERSDDCIEKLVKALETIAREFHQSKQSHRYFTGEATIDPDVIIECWICDKPFGEVFHHCHYSGKFLGLAHNGCNLKRRTLNFIPIVAHIKLGLTSLIQGTSSLRQRLLNQCHTADE